MQSYAVLVKNRESKEMDVLTEGKAKSRRAFIKANKDKIDPLRKGTQFQVVLT